MSSYTNAIPQCFPEYHQGQDAYFVCQVTLLRGTIVLPVPLSWKRRPSCNAGIYQGVASPFL